MNYNCVSNNKGLPPFVQIVISLGLSPLMFWTEIVFLNTHPQAVYYNCVEFYQYQWFIRLEEVALTGNMEKLCLLGV